MKAKLLTLAIAGITALCCIPTCAKPKLIGGIEASQRVNQLTSEISWYHSLGQAQATAQKQGKMIFWVQMLGDMAGAT
jgi:hypothetical protein